ncbi:MAG: hypothetical protein NT031_21030, partial [Planctomycetota bacterium]|nr:hypothetical protein [Planctomycetota bacterium]
ASTSLTFTTRRGATGDGEVDVVDIRLHGSAASVKGPVNLLGGLQVDGTLATLTLDDVAATRGITVGGTGVALNATFDQVIDTSLLSLAPVKSLKASLWRNTDGSADTISAPVLGAISITGECGASWVATGADSKGVAVSSLKVGRGEGMSVVAAAGGVSSLQVKSGHWAGGGLACLWSGAVSVSGDLTDNTWSITQALAGLTVKGAARTSTIRAGGNVGAVKLGAAVGVDLLAGVAADAAHHAQDIADFVSTVAIKSVSVSGLSAGASVMQNCNFSAAAIGACTITT